MRVGLLSLLVVASMLAADAQQPRDVVRARPTGSGAIHGTVMSRDAEPLPLRRARVTIDGVDVDYAATTITADDGTFAFDGLPAGSYTVRAAKEPFIASTAGARRIGGNGAPVPLAPGERRRVDVHLPRGGVITGRVQTPEGEAATGIGVMALTTRYVPSEGERRLAQNPILTAFTDDRGEYRIYGLPPGEYLLSALPTRSRSAGLQVLTDEEVREALAAVTRTLWSPGRPGNTGPPPRATTMAAPSARPMALSQVFHPGTPFLDRATLVRLEEGAVRSGVDIDLTLVPLANIEGSVTLPGGSERVQLIMAREVEHGASEMFRTTTVDASGQFSYRAVPPGHYRIVARSSGLIGTAEVVVGGDDIAGLAIALRPALTVTGRLVFDPPIESMPAIPAFAAPVVPAHAAGFMVASRVAVSGDTFTISGLIPGRYRLASSPQGMRTPLGRWWLKSAIVGGREILDQPLEFHESDASAVLRWSDRASELSGEVRDGAGASVRTAWVVVFSRDPRSWFFHSRRIAAVRPSADGRYTVRNLPAGEYVAVATTEVDTNEWFDPEVLRRLLPQGTTVTISEDGRHTTDLVVRR